MLMPVTEAVLCCLQAAKLTLIPVTEAVLPPGSKADIDACD